jgi:uncharacterized membrane protein YfcA
MEMEIAGYLASLVIGISLGLIGGGGSILTVPVLVYLFRVQPVAATAYSLFIVGSTSLVGSFPKYKTGDVNLKTALIFGIPSIAAVYATRAFIVPAIPENIFSIGGLMVTKSILMMLLFAVLMVFASISMIKTKKESSEEDSTAPQQFNYPLILVMKQAVGTSLLIIAAKSLIGFTGDLGKAVMNWQLLLTVTALAIVGIFIGNRLSKKLNGDSLKKGFGWFVLAMGIYIIAKELIFPGTAGH